MESRRIGWRLMVTLLLGTTLNPLNSSMIAVALVEFHHQFHVSLGTSTWLVAAFYLTGAVSMPLMGRLADLLGARRVFLTGLAVAAVVSVLAPLSPNFGWLVAARSVQALSTSTAFPAGLGLIRAVAGGRRIPAQPLAVMSIAASVSAALGPTIGGVLLSTVGWQGIFLVNLPLTLGGIALGLRWLPAAPPSDPTGGGIGRFDLPGVALFAASVTSLLGALLEFGSPQSWLLLAAFPAAAALLAVRELGSASPFFDLRLLGRNPAMVGVFVQFAAVTLVFYTFFFGLPVWLEEVRHLDPRTAGLLVLPVTGLGVVMTPVAARLIHLAGTRLTLVIGSALLLAGTLLLQLLQPTTPLPLLLAVAVVLGVPNGFNNLGLQARLYAVAPPHRISWAGGQLQTFRYVGATLSSAMLAIVFRDGASTAGLHLAALLLSILAALLVATSTFGGSRLTETTGPAE